MLLPSTAEAEVVATALGFLLSSTHLQPLQQQQLLLLVVVSCLLMRAAKARLWQ